MIDLETITRGKRSSGLTMTELLVTIAIICVLAALLLPVLAAAAGWARAVPCQNHLREVGAALQMYVNDNGKAYPYAIYIPDPSRPNLANAHWFNKLEPYYPPKWASAAYHCPGYRGAIDADVNWPRRHDALGSYAYNFRGIAGYSPRSSDGLGLGAAYGSVRPFPISQNQIKSPSGMLAIGESRFRAEPGVTNQTDGVDGMFCGYLTNQTGQQISFPARHGKKYNQLFCDEHVEGIDPLILFSPARSAAKWNNDDQPHRELWPPN
jgi:prepilin-type N-terminal cleavage/methylation domain-containing protein